MDPRESIISAMKVAVDELYGKSQALADAEQSSEEAMLVLDTVPILAQALVELHILEHGIKAVPCPICGLQMDPYWHYKGMPCKYHVAARRPIGFCRGCSHDLSHFAEELMPGERL